MNSGADCVQVCMPFQCELCWMRNLEGRDIRLPQDFAYVRAIRRANLDAMYGIARATIDGHRREQMSIVRYAEEIHKTPSLEPRGPMPVGDLVGMGVAVDLLQKTLRAKGRKAAHIQFSVARKVRATYSRNWESSARGVSEGASFAKGMGRVRPTECPTQSEWFQDFLRGCEMRMGSTPGSNLPLAMDAIAKLLDFIQEDAEGEEIQEEAHLLWKAGAYICILTVASLRGHEGFYADLSGIRLHLDNGRNGTIPPNLTRKTILTEEACRNLPHVTICLLGKFKGESATGHHLVSVANVTSSGLKPRWWIEKVVEVCAAEGRTSGPVFADAAGEPAASADYDAIFRVYLKRVQSETSLVPLEHNVDTAFSTFRTPRKSSTTRMKRAGFSPEEQDEMNRWRVVEKAQGKAPRLRMNMHYAAAVEMMPVTWRISHAL